MNWLRSFLVSVIIEVLFKSFDFFEPKHMEGKSTGTTEAKMKKKLRERGWIE